ncbi:MAG: glycerol-3-phosphate dehydrogenase [Parerythrobacter sp.]
MADVLELLVIGGGINGAGIARDAAGRGLSTMLVEKDDLAQHTSSASTKLVHGGLRYLEHYEFRLVRESLIERERLLKIAPHIVWPLRFVLPHDSGLRPRWLLRLGLAIYDHIGGRKLLPPTRTLDLRDAPHGNVLQERLRTGFEYSDCWVEDARLVVLNCVDAKERGANIRTRTECIGLTRHADHWDVTLRNASGAEEKVAARRVVNAAGPWVDGVLSLAIPGQQHANLRLVKGSHLIFPRLFAGDHAYIFQNRDDRIVFAIPYERDFTLVGTTDVGFEGDAGGVAISDDEAAYICDAVNEYLRVPVAPADAVSSYSGVRPLYDDLSRNNATVTRDYTFEYDDGTGAEGGAPILSVFGGKITTYRKLAEAALTRFGVEKAGWTAEAALPGGDFAVDGFDALVAQTAARYPDLDLDLCTRLCRAYGTRVSRILGNSADLTFAAPGVLEAELRYLRDVEFARTLDDVLWRRSKLGLHLGEAGTATLEEWFARTGTGR